MPFEVVKVPGGFKVQNTDSKKYYSLKPQTEEEAKAQMAHIMKSMGSKLSSEKELKKS